MPRRLRPGPARTVWEGGRFEGIADTDTDTDRYGDGDGGREKNTYIHIYIHTYIHTCSALRPHLLLRMTTALRPWRADSGWWQTCSLRITQCIDSMIHGPRGQGSASARVSVSVGVRAVLLTCSRSRQGCVGRSVSSKS